MKSWTSIALAEHETYFINSEATKYNRFISYHDGWINAGIAVTSYHDPLPDETATAKSPKRPVNYRDELNKLPQGAVVLLWVNKGKARAGCPTGVVAVGLVTGNTTIRVDAQSDGMRKVSPWSREEFHRKVEWIYDLRSFPVSSGEVRRLWGTTPSRAIQAVQEVGAKRNLFALLVQRGTALSPASPWTYPGDGPLPQDVLDKATPEYIWQSVQLFAAGDVRHRFSAFAEDQVVTRDGRCFPAEAVFGVALSLALGGAPIETKHIAGSEASWLPLLKAAGFLVMPKDQCSADLVIPAGSEDDDAEWEEGGYSLRTHYSRERASELVKAKKAQYRRLHGKLTCERCGLDPVELYGTSEGEACIEVHHALVQVGAMARGHRTKLADVQCLCANCHRLVHRMSRTPAPAS